MSNELKPCPFCGGDAINVMFMPERKRQPYYFAVQCKKCSIKGPSFEIDDKKSTKRSDKYHDSYEISKQGSIEAWNKRI